jgi:antibiotic biosynthesis monooxygenase (ABM) superfamily enzyme
LTKSQGKTKLKFPNAKWLSVKQPKAINESWNCEQREEGQRMIKVIVGYKVRRDEDIQPILLKLRSHAMQYPGFMGAENLLSEENSSIIAVIQSWERTEDWKTWEKSSIRQDLLRQARALLEEEPKITIYRVIPTVRWV